MNYMYIIQKSDSNQKAEFIFGLICSRGNNFFTIKDLKNYYAMINKQDSKEINFIEDDIHSLDEEDQMA